MKKTILAAILLAAFSFNAQAEETTETTDMQAPATLTSDMTLSDLAKNVQSLAERIEIHGYAQGGYDYNSSDNSNTFNFKRTIVWAKANITDRWSFLYMHDFKSSSLEYYLNYSASKLLNIRMGQFKHSYSLENPLSPARVEAINCYSQPVMWLAGYTDPLTGNHGGRDIGLLFYGEAGNTGLKYELGIMNGQGININDKNREKDFILKLDYQVAKSLRIVTSGQLGHGHAVADSYWTGIENGQNYRRDRVSAGFEYTSKPFNLRSEWLKGWDGDVQSHGAYVTMNAPICKKVDAVASYDFLDKNTKANANQSNYMVGLQYWFYPKCRIQAQYTRCCPTYQKDYNLLQVQTQICF